MGGLIVFGLGLLVGALGGFGGGRRYERAHHAGRVAAEYLSVARFHAARAVGGVALFAVVAAAGALLIWFGRSGS